MKVMTGAVLTAVIATGVFSADRAEALSAKDCATIEGWARTVMEARQKGIPMVDLMSIVMESEEPSKILKGMVMAAYDEPAYQTESVQERTINEFANGIYLSCLQGASD